MFDAALDRCLIGHSPTIPPRARKKKSTASNGAVRVGRDGNGTAPSTTNQDHKTMNSAKQQSGVVIFFDRFGFIRPNDGAPDVFVHRADLNGVETLQRDQRVTFEIGEGRDGRKKAVNVKLAA